MKKLSGAIMLIAGTCIGSGMIALPMALAKLGIIPSILLMFTIWCIIYYTSLVNVELNLLAKTGMTLGALGRKFSGKMVEFIGTSSFKVLTYSLLTAYIYGGSSVLQNMLVSFGYEYEFNHIALVYSLVAVMVLCMPLRLLDYLNRMLFIGLVSIVALLIMGLASKINWNNLPLLEEGYKDLSSWVSVIPIVFTAFGFQVIFHTLTNYCEQDSKILKRAFLWGSLIPVVVYVLWTISILGVIYQDNNIFYYKMVSKRVEVGELIKNLSSIAKWHFVQLLIWWISLLAIITSVLGVGMGVCDSIKSMIAPARNNILLIRGISAFITIFPAYCLAVLIPNAFIKVLGFAGMILVFIAVLLPIYLLFKIKNKELHYKEVGYNSLLFASVIMGALIMLCEMFNMINAV